MQGAVRTLLAVCAVAYLISFVCLVIKRKRTGMLLLAAGWLTNAAIFVLNWILCGDPPFGNMYHVLIVLGMSFVPLRMFLVWRDKLSMPAHYFAVASLVPLTGAYFMNGGIAWQRVPALQSPWFVPHVFAYMVSYALMALAFAMTAVKVFRQHVLRSEGCGWRGEASYQVARLAFPFMTFGLLSGALWAEEAWGRYWSWDPKETWALITWLMYIIYFHCRRCEELKKYQDIAQILAFLALIATFVLVNILPRLGSSLHSYAS